MRSSLAHYLFVLCKTARHAPFKRYVGMLLSSCLLVTAMVFCAPPINQAPAQLLAPSIRVVGQYTSAPQGVIIEIAFSQGGAPGNNLNMTCDGVAFQHQFGRLIPTITAPRQPAGGTYHCVYTDEKGFKTSLDIPIPPGTLAITSPAPHATIPLPPSALVTPTATPAPGTLRPPELVGTLSVHYILPTPPSGGRLEVVVDATCGQSHIAGLVNAPTGAYTLTDAHLDYGKGFEVCTPGTSGTIELIETLSWTPPPGGFGNVTIEYNDTLRIPVTWSKS